jgi:membrane protein DedA with SNARE-associated domain
LLFPTDLTSFLELIRQHGDAAYSFMFAYAAAHSLLLALFAGYAAHSGALSFGTLIVVCWFGSFTGDVIRFWIGRAFGMRWLRPFPQLDAPSRLQSSWRTVTMAG